LRRAASRFLTDAVRTADDDNPNGYYEFELVKKLPDGQNKWLSEANHKVVKIISALLEHLPTNYRYKIIFIEREPREILASQQKMLANRNEKSGSAMLKCRSNFKST